MTRCVSSALQPQLETERFLLRPLTEADVGQKYLSWMQDPEVVRWLNSRFRSHNIRSCKTFVSRHDNKSSFHLGIFANGNEKHIGNISIDCNFRHQAAQTGTLIGDREFWGQGVVLEARAAVLDWLFDEMRIHRVEGHPWVKNFAAVLNYKKQGFKLEGVSRAALLLEDGARLDVAHYGLLKEEWKER